MSKQTRKSTRNGRIVLAAVAGLLIAQAGVISSDVRGTGSRVERVFLDMQGIVTGLRECADAGELNTGAAWLAGPGSLPEAGFSATANSLTSTSGKFINLLMPDPWGRAYVANVQALAAGHRTVRVLCAGADGTLDTPLTATEAAGDDFLLHLD